MNDTLQTTAPVRDFVARVREALADLTEDEREELVGGLEADLAERVAEDGADPSDLGDPEAYAAELRAAAGLEARGRRRGRRPTRERFEAGLDGARTRWEALVATGRPRQVWDFVLTLRPLWWFFRAWLAVQLVDLLGNGHDLATPVPTLRGVVPGVLVLVVATVVSVQIGRGRWWPGSRASRSLGARSLLLALNGLALLVTPVILGQFPGSGAYTDLYDAAPVEPAAGIQTRGGYVTNVFPYDEQGRPLTGVQLFDQAGRPLAVAAFAAEEYLPSGKVELGYPWYNGGQRLYNVFPLPQRTQSAGPRRESAWTSTNPPRLPTAPLAVVPPVSLPGAPVAEPADPAPTDSEKATPR